MKLLNFGLLSTALAGDRCWSQRSPYSGRVSITKNRRACQNWNSSWPRNIAHKPGGNSRNYCRKAFFFNFDCENENIISGIRITILEDLGVTHQSAIALGNTAIFQNARNTQVNESKRTYATRAAISTRDRPMSRKVDENVQIGKICNTINAERSTKNDQEWSFESEFLPKNRNKASKRAFLHR